MEFEIYRFPAAFNVCSRSRPQPRYTTTETDDAYVISVVLPGVERQDMQVKRIGEKLTVNAAASGAGESCAFEETFSVPEDANLHDVKAETSNGVLRVTVPKKAAELPRAIEVAAVMERDKESYELVYHVPGAGAEQVSVEVTGNELKVAAEAGERAFFRGFERTYTIPQDADANRIRAFCADGVAVVRIPKLAPVKLDLAGEVPTGEDMYTVHLKLPGVASENITVERTRRDVRISVAEAEGERQIVHKHSLRVPRRVDPGQVTAAYKHGVLTIGGPKAQFETKVFEVVAHNAA
mmetsp:Transcript_6474/g.19647  ORF Transcript_6474/g.19647 Transcript_6474/m.19647 type:complete len:295 (+) Transcript_6474:111-995(+)